MDIPYLMMKFTRLKNSAVVQFECRDCTQSLYVFGKISSRASVTTDLQDMTKKCAKKGRCNICRQASPKKLHELADILMNEVEEKIDETTEEPYDDSIRKYV